MGVMLTNGGALTPDELASLPNGAQVWLIIPLGDPTRYGWSPSLKLETYDRRDGTYNRDGGQCIATLIPEFGRPAFYGHGHHPGHVTHWRPLDPGPDAT